MPDCHACLVCIVKCVENGRIATCREAAVEGAKAACRDTLAEVCLKCITYCTGLVSIFT